MKIKDLFLKDISRPINGVVKADQKDEAIIWQELDEYVITQELDKHFRAFFTPYMDSIDSSYDPVVSSRIGVWVSGFFGSGKSHFIKILSYLLANREAHEQTKSVTRTATEFFQNKVQDKMFMADIKRAGQMSTDVILFNIDSKADMGAKDEDSRLLGVFWKVFNEMQGFCSESLHTAKLEQYLTKRNKYDEFCRSFKKILGSDWTSERDAFALIKGEIVEALSETLGKSKEDIEKWLDEVENKLNLTIDNFVNEVKAYLDSKGAQHRVIFLVDEAGQFIGNSTHLMLNLQTLTEDLGRICNGRAWIIVTSQEDIDSIVGDLKSSKANDFSKIQGRFHTRLSLSSNNTDEVIQARLLQKNNDVIPELKDIFNNKGDILKNQLSFSSDSTTMKNYKDEDDFVANYPFTPYHFQLVQKIFESIRKAGASGLHLSRGERSMLDAFQSAAMSISDKDIGALVPLYEFYPCIESFIETTVKRSIDQAGENAGLKDTFDVYLLQTLFLIRYVDIIKPKVENLVTLCIDQVDCDRIELKQKIEESLQRLERENLINSNGDLYYFLTNEEREITREIKNEEISPSDEIRLISEIIFDDILKGKTKHKYIPFKRDYPVNRICDSQPVGTSVEQDISIEVISPLSDQYSDFDQLKCISYTTEHSGRLLIKIADKKELAQEVGIYLRTEKYVRLKADAAASPSLKKILNDRQEENRQRKRRLNDILDTLIINSSFYALGNVQDIQKDRSELVINEALDYIIQNLYIKFSLLKILHDEPLKEMKALLSVDDLTRRQNEMDIDDNAPDIKEVLRYIELKIDRNHPVILSEIVVHFSKVPFGWPDYEIVLLIARLFIDGKIHIIIDGAPIHIREAIDPLGKSSQWKNIKISKRKLADRAEIEKAKKLAKELFGSIGPDSQDELNQFIRDKLNGWKDDLGSFKLLSSTGNYPGEKEITICLDLISKVSGISDTYEFIKAFSLEKDNLLNVSEEVHDLTDFYKNQRTTWESLNKAISEFSPNKNDLENDDAAASSFKRMLEIRDAKSPYNLIKEVNGLISRVKLVNDKLIESKRKSATSDIDKLISRINSVLDEKKADKELREKALSGLHNILEKINQETSIPNMTHLLSLADNQFQETLDQIEQSTKKDDLSPVKEVKIVKPANLSTKTYIETEEDVQEFVTKIKEELTTAVKNNQRVRIL